MSGLDINTPKGQESLNDEQEAIEILSRSLPDLKFIQTTKERASAVDGFVLTNDVLCGFFECKSRDMSEKQLSSIFGNEWLVTFEKISKGAEIAKLFCVPFVGYLYLVPDKVVLSVQIANRYGNFMVPLRIENTETQKTVNGGKIIRTNAYISMLNAKRFQ